MSDIWGILRHLAGIWVGSLNVKEKLIKMMKKSEFLGNKSLNNKGEKSRLGHCFQAASLPQENVEAEPLVTTACLI